MHLELKDQQLKKNLVSVCIYMYIQREQEMRTHTHREIVIEKPQGNHKPKINNRYTKEKAVQTEH